jgi:hypothetical protein
MKNSNDIIGKRTRDLPACSAVPQRTTPPHALQGEGQWWNVNSIHYVHPEDKIKWCKLAKPFMWKLSFQEVTPGLQCENA